MTGTAAISVPGAADCRMDVDTTDHGWTEDKSELALQGYESARTLTAGCLKLVFHGDIWPRLKSSLAAAFGSSKQGWLLFVLFNFFFFFFNEEGALNKLLHTNIIMRSSSDLNLQGLTAN